MLYMFLKTNSVIFAYIFEETKCKHFFLYEISTKDKIEIQYSFMLNVLLPVVRHFLENDNANLPTYFVTCGYMEKNEDFNMDLENNQGKIVDVSSARIES